MLKIGLTGGIGSGKTTVAKIFQRLGTPIYFSDDRAKFIMDTDQTLKEEISEYFHVGLSVEGKLDKKALAKIVFNDEESLAYLNGLIHPRVSDDFENWMKGLPEDTSYILKEAAILYESGAAKFMDAVIVVTAPLDLRIARVMARDSVSEKDVLARMKNQWPEEKKIELANHIVYNDEEHSILKQVVELHILFTSEHIKSL